MLLREAVAVPDAMFVNVVLCEGIKVHGNTYKHNLVDQ